MPKQSAGLLVYRYSNDKKLEVFLAHMGGPFWVKKDEGAWTIPKGEFGEGEDGFEAAKREFKEEIGVEIDGRFIELPQIKQAGGKVVHAWVVEDKTDKLDELNLQIKSNTFTIEWPPKSGKQQEFPEIDRAEWFGIDEARVKILKSQRVLLDELVEKLKVGDGMVCDENKVDKKKEQGSLFG